jgi:xylulokinase
MRAEEGPAFGAVLLAGVGAGVYADTAAAVAATVATSSTVEPDPAAMRSYDAGYAIYRTLYGVLKSTFEALSAGST